MRLFPGLGLAVALVVATGCAGDDWEWELEYQGTGLRVNTQADTPAEVRGEIRLEEFRQLGELTEISFPVYYANRASPPNAIVTFSLSTVAQGRQTILRCRYETDRYGEYECSGSLDIGTLTVFRDKELDTDGGEREARTQQLVGSLTLDLIGNPELLFDEDSQLLLELTIHLIKLYRPSATSGGWDFDD